MVTICEVGPRDGLQNLDRIFTPCERAELICGLAGAGLTHIEAVSFVNPKRVPQMADAEEVLDLLPELPGVELSGLVLNGKGVERALNTRLTELRFVIVASETFSMRNQNATVAEGLAQFAAAAKQVSGSGIRLVGVIGTAYGCPFEGNIATDKVAEITERLVQDGADEVIFADTVGVGSPVDIRRIGDACLPKLGSVPFGVHLHNTRNTGYANVIEAVQLGARVLDSSIAGLGGCPFAPKATGNIATEDLDYLLSREGMATGLDHEALAALVEDLRAKLPGKVTGQLAAAGWPFSA